MVLMLNNVLESCQALKPSVLIGSSGQRSTFTKEVLETLSSINEVMSLCFSSLFPFRFGEISAVWSNFFPDFLKLFYFYRNLWSWLFPTQHHMLSALQRKHTHGPRLGMLSIYPSSSQVDNAIIFFLSIVAYLINNEHILTRGGLYLEVEVLLIQ